MFSPARPSRFVAPDWLPQSAPPRPVLNPATLEVEGQIADTGTAEMEAALATVTAAQALWRRQDAKSRARVLHRIASDIEATDLSRCAELMTQEMGKPYPEAVGELANCAAVFRYYAEMARDEAGKVAGTTQAGSFQYARYEALGVSVHIMPFNFPILLMCWTLAASLAAGNACIVKPAPATTLCTLEFMRVFVRLPQGLLACLPGGAELAQALVASPLTHAVAFTGSAGVARDVAQAAAAGLKPAVIEAGGSDPMIISAHAPIEIAARGAVTAAFHLSGQVCTSTERFYVVDSVHDAFVAAFVRETARLRIGNGLGAAEIGPLVSSQARDRVMRLVEDALAKGARLVAGGRIPEGLEKGWFYAPTILTDCHAGMALLQEECFGPVAPIVRVPDFETALREANASRFGLGAAVFTTDLAEAMTATEQLEAGMVWVNNPMIDNDALPFGGWKASGMGRELGRQGLDAFRRTKMVVLDHRPVVQDWWYPYPEEWFFASRGRKHSEEAPD